MAKPIAELLQEWRDRAFAQPHNSTLDGLCDELEAAIKAQCEAWEERRKEALGYEEEAYQYCIADLKGEP